MLKTGFKLFDKHTLPKRGFATKLTSGSTPETIPMSLKDSPMLLACNVE